MIAARGGPNFFELDAAASAQNSPYLIFTADGPFPKEIDDGINVEPLPSATEAYRVRICIADTSSAYYRDEVVKHAQTLVEARYLTPQGSEGYTPLLPEPFIKQRELKAGQTKSALVISYIVGENCPPTDVDVQFGNVEIARNYTYRKFGSKCRFSPEKQPIARAASLTRAQLGVGWNSASVLEEMHSGSFCESSSTKLRDGERITSTFMVGGCHLVGRWLKERDLLAIYRIHDPSDTTLAEFIDTSVARFSQSPGRHVSLGLEPYCRVTSPLRRLEDFVMNGLLKVYAAGDRNVGTRDERVVLETVRALNQRIASAQRDSRKRQTTAWLAHTIAKNSSAA